MFVKRSNTVIIHGDIAIGIEKWEVIYVTGAVHNSICLYNFTILENNGAIFACGFYLHKHILNHDTSNMISFLKNIGPKRNIFLEYFFF